MVQVGTGTEILLPVRCYCAEVKERLFLQSYIPGLLGLRPVDVAPSRPTVEAHYMVSARMVKHSQRTTHIHLGQSVLHGHTCRAAAWS